jgi:Mg/Co/Ni transporter MgtE
MRFTIGKEHVDERITPRFMNYKKVDLWIEALIGHGPSLIVDSRFGQLHRLKAAEIADLIETATLTEQNEILTQVHGDPELEADVLEELDDERQAQLLKTRTATEVAEVLARMRTDDAAGGLMALEFLASSRAGPSVTPWKWFALQPGNSDEALTTIYPLDNDDTLTGCISLVSALQQDPSAVLREVVTGDPIHASPSDDIIDITTRIADFNLLTLPVLDDRGHILVLITVDDALEAAIPEDWRRREKQQHETVLGTSEPR